MNNDINDDLNRALYGAFVSALRNVGVSVTTKQMEDLRMTMAQLAKNIRIASRETSVNQARALQEGVKQGFKMIEADLDVIENRVYRIEKSLGIDARDPKPEEIN